MLKTSHKFTLIELLITMTIGIILIGLVGQNLMKKPAGIRRREALNQIKVCFSDARMLALATNSTTAIELSSDGQKIQVIQVSKPVDLFATSSRMREEEREHLIVKHRVVAKPISFELPNGCQITPSDENIETEAVETVKMFQFYPEGEASGKNYTLKTGDKSFDIKVDQLTGQLIITENSSQ